MERLICTVTNDLTYDQRMIRICTSLSRAGYTVTLVGRQRPGSVPLAERPFAQVRLRCHFDTGKLFYLEYNLRLWWWLARQRFDAVCAVDLDTILPAFFWCRLRGKPCVYDAHEYFTEVPEVVRRPMVQRIWSAVARLTIPRLRYAYTVGPELARIFEERYGTPFAVVRNVPFARADFPDPPKPHPRIILYQGALNEGRGLETAIAAMQQVENAVLWLAGEGDCSQTLREQVQELELEAKVRFLGYLQPEELRDITPKAYIGLNLLENRGLSYYYSLANKAFDYLQAGVPAIHMAFPEYEALHRAHPGFLLLDKLEPSALATVLNQLLQDEALYKKLREACRLAAAELTWEREEGRLLEVYQSLKTSMR